MSGADHRFGRLVGGRLCLDFTNSVGGRVRSDGGPPVPGRSYIVVDERLTTYGDLVRWGVVAGAVDARTARRLAQRAPAAAADHANRAAWESPDAVLERARALRESLYRVFVAAVEGVRPTPADLARLNVALRAARARQYVVAARGRLAAQGTGAAGGRPGVFAGIFRYEWLDEGAVCDRVLWPVALSAAELLTGADLSRVGRCPGERCGWLFLDMSRSGRRQWCDMATCGNVAKVRRHRARRAGGG
jgi:predicted RNA-binding Zn ribbon-like protein